ncbi:MAG: two-component regulator propeller domain-containing protein [Bacteroidota bacterium]
MTLLQKTKLIGLGFFLLSASLVFCQTISFDQVSTAQGLSQSNVTCVVQDKNGFIWIGTDDGLNRYDGYTFKIYEYIPGDDNSLPTSSIRSLFVSKDGTLWVGSYGGGLCRYLPEKDGFEAFKPKEGDESSFSHLMVLSITEDIHGNIWAGTEQGGLNRLSFPKGKKKPIITRFKHQEGVEKGLSNNLINSVYSASNGDLLVGSWQGVDILDVEQLNTNDPEGVTVENITYEEGNTNSLTSRAVWTIIEGNREEYWVGTWGGGLNRVKKYPNGYTVDQFKTAPIVGDGLNSLYIYDLHLDKEGLLWVGTFEKGLNILDTKTGKFQYFVNESGNPNYLSSNFVSSIIEDRSGVVWVATYGGGLDKYERGKKPIKVFSQENDDANSLSNNFVFAIHEDDKGCIWVGTHGGGLNKIIPDSDIAGQYEVKTFREGVNGFPSDVIISIEEDSEGKLWVGTRKGLIVMDKDDGTFNEVPNNPDDPKAFWGRYIWDIHQGNDGTMWIGSRRGLNRLNKGAKKWIHYVNDPDDPKSLSRNSAHAIIEDSRGWIWVGTHAGLNLMKSQTDETGFIRFIHVTEDPRSLSGNVVYCIKEDHAGRIWVGTNNGLSCILQPEKIKDDSKTNFWNFNSAQGLADDKAYGILEDDIGDFWVSTNEGISNFSPDRLIEGKNPIEVVTNYDQTDGLQSNEFNMGAFYKNREGRLFFGGNVGFNSFLPSEIRNNDYLPPVQITEIRVRNEPIPIPANGKLNLSWRDYGFAFEFAAMSYIQPSKNQYAYQMVGFDPDMIFSGTRRFVNYSNLDPGKYEFKVIASNNDDLWNNTGTAVSINIPPPPWKTWWAYLLYGLATVGLVSGYIQYQVNRKRKELETLAKIEKAKVDERERVRKKSSADFHDELGNKLTKISLFIELAKRQAGANNQLSQFLGKIEKNAQMLSNGIRDFIWILDPEKDSLADALTRLTAFGNSLFEHSETAFEAIISNQDFSKIELPVDTRRHLVLLFKEAMNNSLKYANAKKVELKAEQNGRGLVISLSDNGVGFDSQEKSTGYGLKNMQQRAVKTGGQLKIISSKDEGVVIELVFPSGINEAD